MSKIGFVEDMTHEFKSDAKRLSDGDLIDAVVAFANSDGGELYLGVEDDGEILGLHRDHMDATRVSALVANRTVPPVAVRATVMDLGLPVLKIEVPRCRAVVASASGKMQRRRLKADGTPENVPMYPHEITSRLSSLGQFDYTAQPVPDASRDDLDALERERMRGIIRAHSGEAALLELSDEELDKAMRLVVSVGDELVPTFGGLLLIGRRDRLRALMPTAESAVQVLEGTEVRVNESFCLPLLAAFERISDVSSAWNRERELESGPFRVSVPDFDRRAFREAVVNAYSHRDWSRLGRVIVRIDDDGLTVSNPGGFIEGISSDRLIDAEPHGRNPSLADAMKRIGLAERTGRGIDRIYEGALLYGRMPDWSRSTESGVTLFIPKGPTDPALIQLLASETRRTGRSMSIFALLAMNILRELDRATIKEIAKEARASEARIRPAVEELVSRGLAEAAGSGRERTYMLSKAYLAAAHDFVSYTRQRDIGPAAHEELIMRFARQHGSVTRQDVIELLHVTAPQAYRLLADLAERGRLELIGKGRGAKYIVC